jgi:hypothetical protein
MSKKMTHFSFYFWLKNWCLYSFYKKFYIFDSLSKISVCTTTGKNLKKFSHFLVKILLNAGKILLSIRKEVRTPALIFFSIVHKQFRDFSRPVLKFQSNTEICHMAILLVKCGPTSARQIELNYTNNLIFFWKIYIVK